MPQKVDFENIKPFSRDKIIYETDVSECKFLGNGSLGFVYRTYKKTDE